MRGDVGDVYPDAPALPLPLGGDGVVEVTCRRRIDREGVQLDEIAARTRARRGGVGHPSRFALQRGGEAAPLEPFFQQRFHRLPRGTWLRAPSARAPRPLPRPVE